MQCTVHILSIILSLPSPSSPFPLPLPLLSSSPLSSSPTLLPPPLLLLALLDDWVGSEPNDLVNFVPYDWTIDIHLTQYEIFLFTNQCNWLDLLKGDMENTRLGFCGATGTISFGLPFTEFLPMKQMIHFSAKVNLVSCMVVWCLPVT